VRLFKKNKNFDVRLVSILGRNNQWVGEDEHVNGFMR
jgi:hypothetical protein